MKMKPTSLLTLSAAAFLLLGPAAAQAQTPTYQQVWADEFTTGISPSWKFETGGGGWGNNEKQYYQAANATVVNGELQITARKQTVGGMPYTSARMTTQGLKEFTYGKMEARIKMPIGQGLWPAFWMLGANINTVSWPRCGEIDVLEHVNIDNKVYGTIHWDNNGGHAQYGGNTTVTTADYHVYSVEWAPTAIRWYVDGVKYHEADITNGINSTEEFQRPFFLLLNLAVAGDWPGATVDESKLPATMSVDYVRVYQLMNAPAPAPAATLIQAEAYSSMKGVQVETTTDTGGGQDVGYIDAGDYMVYNNITFPTTGTYLLEYRVASPSGGTVSSDLNAGAIQLGNTVIPATGGWQTWTTVSRTVTVNAGTYNFGVFAQTGGWNINWVRISKSGTAARGTVGAAPAADELELYPNPATDRVVLHSAHSLIGSQYRILDAVGRLVASGGASTGRVDVSALKPGLYTLLLTQEGQDGPRQLTRRFTK